MMDKTRAIPPLPLVLALACIAVVGAATAGSAWAQSATSTDTVDAADLADLADAVDAPAPAYTVDPALAAPKAGELLPPVRDRAYAVEPTLELRGFRVEGVGEHPRHGITPASMQALADARFAALSGGVAPARLSFDQLEEVAAALTTAYREAGFVVATAYLPAQTPGPEGTVRIEVVEGRLGEVVVQGTRRYRPGVVAAPLEALRGQPLHKSGLDSALLYMRDLPGVSTSSVLQPGSRHGETDLVVVASEAERPWRVNLGLSNHGTELTGRYRALVGLAWDSPLGRGDSLTVNYVHAFSPQQSNLGAIDYSIPVTALPGLGLDAGYSRGELEINTGPFAVLDLKGPTTIAYVGARWKFVNRETLQMETRLRWIRERSRLDALGFQMSDHRFDVLEAGYTMRRVDRRFRGVDLVQASVRHALADDSGSPDLISPRRDSDFTVAYLGYVRMQYLSRSQRLYLKLHGQYSDDVLVPMEQFAIGGPDSVRAYPISDALGDRGYSASLEYHVDAPGFGDRASPFGGKPWRELLQFELFLDHGRVSPSPGNRSLTSRSVTFQGAGAGLLFRLPAFHDLEFRLAAAVPLGDEDASDDDDFRVWARFGMTF